MPKVQTSCPNCNQPIVTDIFQVVDVNQDPRLKEMLLAGRLNFAQCQVCGFQGQLPVPLVFHDGDKELLLTFTPPDPNKTMEEKEAALAPLLKQITENLDPEERKGYLFQPQAMLTMNNLVKNILLADGITEEMIQAQQEQMRVLERLLSANEDQLVEIIKENQEKLDREFFGLFAEIAQQVVATRDEESIQKIQQIQNVLMEETEIGKSIKMEAEEIRAATQSLESLGNNLTRDSLLELILNAPNLERVKAYASLVRPAMDYEFFQTFTERIENSESEERKKMVERRNLLLSLTEEIDKQLNDRLEETKNQIEVILESDSVEEAIMQNLGAIDQLFIQVTSAELKAAQENDDQQRIEKLSQMLQIIQTLTTPPELEVIESLLGLSDDEDAQAKVIDEIDDQLLTRIIDYLTSIITNYDQQIDADQSENTEQIKQTVEKLKQLYNSLLRKSMEQKMKSS
jgi:hypothetical protein